MEIKKIRDEILLKEFKVTVPSEEIERRVDAKLASIVPNVKIDGFRPGKIPQDVMRKRYGSSAYQEVLETLVGETTDKIVKDNNLRPAMSPQYRPDPFDEGKSFSYGCVIELLPEISTLAIEKIALTRFHTPVDDKKLEEALNRIKEDNKETGPVEEDRALKDKDIAIIDFKGFVDDKPLPQGEAQDYELAIGSNSFIEGFEEKLLGMKKGDKRVIELTFPKEYHVPEIAGKPVRFDVTLKEIRKFLPAKLDDALAKRLGMNSIEDLKSKMKGHLLNEYQGLSNRLLKQELLDALDKEYAFALPEGMVNMEFDAICAQINEGKGDKKEAAVSDAEKEELRAEYFPIAERRVRLGLVLSDTAQKENIIVTPTELQAELMERARGFPGQEQQVVEYYQKNQEALASLKAPILEGKVIQHMIEKANLKEEEITLEALQDMVNNKDKEVEAGPKKAAPKKTAKKKASS